MIAFVVSFACAISLVGLVILALLHWGVMDVPNDRSSHARPVPRGGGIALLPSMALGIAASGSWPTELVCLLLGAVVLGLVGLVDDIRDVSALARLALQLGITLAVSTALLSEYTDLSMALGIAGSLTGAGWLAGFVNVFNFMDGANGVAGFQALVAGGWFAYIGEREDVTSLLVGGLALSGAALGFLPWNFPRARVFMGDVGSYSVGLVLGSLSMVTLLATDSPILAIAPLLIFLSDSTLTLARRAAAGKPVMTAHREHVYQRLTTVPGSPWPAIATTAAALTCVLAATTPVAVCLACWVFTILVYISLPRLVGRKAATT